MVEKYTLNEIREMIPKHNRTGPKRCQELFWEDLDEIEKAVEHFSDLMRDKMFDKAIRGYSGWDDQSEYDYIKTQLQVHVDKGDYVDIANICMMLLRFCKG